MLFVLHSWVNVDLQFLLFFFYLCDILARDAIVTFKMCVSVDQRTWSQAFCLTFRNGNSSSMRACSVVCCFLWPRGLQPTRLLRPWDLPGKNTGVGCHFLLQDVFLTQGLNRVSCLAGRLFTIWATREALVFISFAFSPIISPFSFTTLI